MRQLILMLLSSLKVNCGLCHLLSKVVGSELIIYGNSSFRTTPSSPSQHVSIEGLCILHRLSESLRQRHALHACWSPFTDASFQITLLQLHRLLPSGENVKWTSVTLWWFWILWLSVFKNHLSACSCKMLLDCPVFIQVTRVLLQQKYWKIDQGICN